MTIAEQLMRRTTGVNDGVRLNICPSMADGVLRLNDVPKLNITGDKSRSQDVESSVRFMFIGVERMNDFHLTLAETTAEREARGG